MRRNRNAINEVHMSEDEINEMLGKGARAIDITPSMLKEATGHYEAIAGFLENNGIRADVSPYGSIVMGTPTRPLSDRENEFFDIDALVKRTDLDILSCRPEEVREPVEDLLVSSKLYGDKIDTCDSCITVNYVLGDIDDGFRLDLSTGVANPDDPSAAPCATYPEYADTTIAIARRNSPEWLGSNPRGLCNWFLGINERFAASGRQRRKASIAAAYPAIYESAEQVPDDMDRSPLQQALQIAKRSRDEFYRRCGCANVPASCILTVVFGKVAATMRDDASILDFLNAFVAFAGQSASDVRAGEKSFFGRTGGWTLMNPVYGEDMLEGWNDSDAKMFFNWAEDLGKSLLDLTGSKAKAASSVEAIFGAKTGKRILPAAAAALGVSAVAPTRPWRA